MFLKAFENATIIPDNATTGDMIKVMFPDLEIRGKSESTVHLTDRWRNPLMFVQIPLTMWNAPYKEVEE